MKALKFIGVLILFVIVILLIVAIFLPSNVYVERETTIRAPAEKVFEQVNTMENWDNWSPFPEADPDMIVVYEGKKSGVGAIQSWTMSGDSGRLTIIVSEPYSRIRTKLDVFENNSAYGNWTFTETGDSTVVKWGVEVHDLRYPMGRYLGLFMPVMMNPSFDKGLRNLKEHTENLQN